MDTLLDVAPLSMEKTGLKKNALKGEVAVVTGGGSNGIRHHTRAGDSRFGRYHPAGVPADELAYPQPETVPVADFERINDHALSPMFAYMGPGFPEPKVPLRSINYSDGTEYPLK